MPKFKIKFSRTYTISEGFERVVEAPSLAEAVAASSGLAQEFNGDCPDDCSEDERGWTEIGCFDADHVAGKPKEAPDYTVLPDGQCVPYEEQGDAEA